VAHGGRPWERSGAPRPAAIRVRNGIACVGALTAAAERGLEAPRDPSVVGRDNTSPAPGHRWLTIVGNAGHDAGPALEPPRHHAAAGAGAPVAGGALRGPASIGWRWRRDGGSRTVASPATHV